MSEREKIIAKIRKCLALSASSNEHEAAAALRQARKLMDAHGVSDLDVDAANAANEAKAKAGAMRTPPKWEASLAVRIADAFGCNSIFHSGGWSRHGAWGFIGCGAAPEVAQYAFAVLLRQLKRARSEHIKAALKRCKTATKTRRADLFAEGWVRAVTAKIDDFAGNEQQAAAIAAYFAVTYPNAGALATRDRNDGRRLRDYEVDDLHAGHRAGRNAELNRGVGGAEQRLALGGAR